MSVSHQRPLYHRSSRKWASRRMPSFSSTRAEPALSATHSAQTRCGWSSAKPKPRMARAASVA